MSRANELLRKDGSAEINGLPGTHPAKLAVSGEDQGHIRPLAERYGRDVEGAGARRIKPPSWFRAEQLAMPIEMIYARDLYVDRPLEDGERRLGRYILPPFQRPAVWTRGQQVRFIESLWAGLPVGAYVFNQRPDHQPTSPSGWLLDGQQRLTAVIAYVNDEFPVLDFTWSELPEADRRGFGFKPFIAYRTNTSDIAECMEVYDRLAYGGTAHEPKALPTLTPETGHER